MRDTRTESRRTLGLRGFRPDRAALLTVACVVVGFAAGYLPVFSGLPPAARVTLQILVTAALLWVTEAMPPFAVGVLAMAADIALRGRPGGVFAREPRDWKMFVRPSSKCSTVRTCRPSVNGSPGALASSRAVLAAPFGALIQQVRNLVPVPTSRWPGLSARGMISPKSACLAPVLWTLRQPSATRY